MPLTEEQVAQRKAYIGASEAAAVLGMSRWDTPLGVWARKTGEVEEKDISDKLPVRVGNELEELVAKLFSEESGLKVRRANITRFHKKHKFLGANLDRLVVGTDEILECKTASGWKAKEWEGEEIPQEYILQVYHQLLVTGKKKGYIACLIGGNADFRWKEVVRDEDILKDMEKRMVAFWRDFVEPKVMPTVITKNDGDTLYDLFPSGMNPDPIVLDDSAARLIEGIQANEEQMKLLKGDIDKAKNELKAMLKDSDTGIVGGFKVTWRDQESRRVDSTRLKKEAPELFDQFSKVTKTRVLRIGKHKEAK